MSRLQLYFLLLALVAAVSYSGNLLVLAADADADSDSDSDDISDNSIPGGDEEDDDDDEAVVEDAPDQQPTYAYTSPEAAGPVFLAENFDDRSRLDKAWVRSQAKKDDIDDEIAKYDGLWAVEEPKRSVENGNLGLVLKSKARHAAVSTLLNKPFVFDQKPLIVQYEVIFQEGQECGGAYLKLLTQDPKHRDLKDFHDKTPYSIMFGPDKCGNDHKLHFIFRHKNPLNGSIEEKHAKKPKERLEDFFKDKQPHLYSLVVRPDNTFTVKVDGVVVNDGSLLDDFSPPVNPPLEIEDPADKRPEDWDEREKIPDPTATKPDDWDEEAPTQIVDEADTMPEGWLEDEPLTVPSAQATKPEDWDEDMDGEWEPPEVPNPKCEDAPGCGEYKKRMIANPNYKGKWWPPLIDNPNYRGKWTPKMIHNPDYFNDEHPFRMAPIHAIGFELWSMSPDILFDNVIVTDDESVAKKWSEDTFELRKQRIAIEGTSMWQGILNFTSENPWIWTVYILLLGIPVVLVIYCCCFTSQDDKEPKEEEEAEAEELLKKDNEEAAAAAAAASKESDAEQDKEEDSIEQSDDNEEETEEIIKEDKREPSVSSEGPRRRKPNKE